jgi:hypothetical protein
VSAHFGFSFRLNVLIEIPLALFSAPDSNGAENKRADQTDLLKVPPLIWMSGSEIANFRL